MKKFLLCASLIIVNFLYSGAQENYELLYIKGDFSQIEKMALRKSTAEDFYWYAMVLEDQGKSKQAINILEEGLSTFKDNEKLELLISSLYFETGNYQKAELYLNQLRHNPSAFIQLVQVNEFRNNHQRAISLLQDRILDDSTNTQYLKHLGDNYLQIDSIPLALKYYRHAFLIDSADQVTAAKLVNLYIRRKEFDKAVKICESILRTDSTNNKFVKLMAISHFNKGKFSEAESYFQKLYNAGDSNRFVLKHLGICKLNTYSYSDSRNYLLSAFALDSNDIEICFCLGKAFLNSMWPEKGLYYYNRADSLSQADPKVLSAIHMDKESIYNTLGNFEEALKEYHIAYKLDPKPEYLFFIASLYQNKLENKKKALKYYETFLAVLPDLSESEIGFQEEQVVISLKKVAEDNIRLLKEEIFFDGE